jgi:uracil phosphoribosyltransferase
MFPDGKTGFIGLKRNEKTLEPYEYMFSFPEVTERTSVYVLDVMLATGNSLKSTLARLQMEGVEDITVCCVIATPEGIENVLAEYNKVNIITATLDRCLNDVGYILPGLGDAGDRVTGMA